MYLPASTRHKRTKTITIRGWAYHPVERHSRTKYFCPYYLLQSSRILGFQNFILELFSWLKNNATEYHPPSRLSLSFEPFIIPSSYFQACLLPGTSAVAAAAAAPAGATGAAAAGSDLPPRSRRSTSDRTIRRSRSGGGTRWTPTSWSCPPSSPCASPTPARWTSSPSLGASKVIHSR